MDAQATGSVVEELRRKVLSMDSEMREIRRQLGALIAAKEIPTVSVADEEIDREVLMLVGVDPPLPVAAEREEIRNVVAARYATA